LITVLFAQTQHRFETCQQFLATVNYRLKICNTQRG